MEIINKLLIAAAALAFFLAVFGALGFNALGLAAEGYSRACSNLALLAIASHLVFKKQ